MWTFLLIMALILAEAVKHDAMALAVAVFVVVMLVAGAAALLSKRVT